MEQYLLCGALAEHPYYVKQLGLRLYSAEELCYYIYNNLPLVDENLIDESLLTFLRDELHLQELTEKLERSYHSHSDLEAALLLLLREVGYYNELEITRFQERFSRLRRQNPQERSLARADKLFERKRYEGAICEYSGILAANRDLRLKPYFYSQVLQHMGAAYMQLGLCDEALECLQAAYRESEEPCVLQQMYFWAMATGRPFAKELESVDASQLTQWQKRFLEAENHHLAVVQTEESQLLSGEQEEAYLAREKKEYRQKIGEESA